MKRKKTILSDSHGNFHALKSVINDAENKISKNKEFLKDESYHYFN